MTKNRTIKTAERIRGLALMPGDKSLSHRALILSALSNGKCRIENLSKCEDVRSTIKALRQLGVTITLAPDGESAMVEGVSGNFTPSPDPIDCGNSGTTMRLLSGVLAAQPFKSILTGDESLKRRPMESTAIPLRQMGAEVTTSENGLPPVVINGGKLRGISYRLTEPSAQIKSAVLIAGLFATGDTVVHEILQTRDHTERLLAKLGGPGLVTIDRMGKTITVNGYRLPFHRFDLVIPGDTSSAAYPVAAAALLPESSVTVPFLGLNPSRIAFFRHLQAMGAQLIMTPDAAAAAATGGEPVGDVTIVSSKLRNVPIAPERIPALIDELPLLSVLGCLADNDWEIRHAERLKVKESDRISTTTSLLGSIGAEVTEHDDGLSGPGNQVFDGGRVDPQGDHRIAMTAAVAAWCAKSPVTISGADCVKISFPDFYERMDELVEYAD